MNEENRPIEENENNITNQSEEAPIIEDEENAPAVNDEADSDTEEIVDEADNAKSDKQKNSIGKEIFEWVYTIVVAMLIAFLIKGFLFDIVKVDGESMLPTLHDSERLIVTRLGYTPHQGDIVILDSNYVPRQKYYETQSSSPSVIEKIKKTYLDDSYKHLYYVKRIVALPGQTVDIRDNKIYVDGKPYEDGYHQGETFKTDPSFQFPHVVGEECVFVLGDNREHSKDSRIIGDVPYDALMGKAQFRLWPINSIGSVY